MCVIVSDLLRSWSGNQASRRLGKWLSSLYIDMLLVNVVAFVVLFMCAICIPPRLSFLSSLYRWVSARKTQLQGLYSLSGKTSYRKISWSLEAARFGFGFFQLLWNLTGISAAALPRCLSNFIAPRSLQHPISRIRDFTRSGGKTSYRLVNRGPVWAMEFRFSCINPSIFAINIKKHMEHYNIDSKNCFSSKCYEGD